MLIGIVVRLVSRGFSMRHLGPTISRYLCNILNVILNIALAVAILGFFGVETTTFAALVAGTNQVIRDAFGEAGYPVPEQHWAMRSSPASSRAARA
jgi:small conductance mechanosensitive channel